MSYEANPNLIIHEIQKTDGIHLSDTARGHIHRLVHEARVKHTSHIIQDKNYWQKKYFDEVKKNVQTLCK